MRSRDCGQVCHAAEYMFPSDRRPALRSVSCQVDPACRGRVARAADWISTTPPICRSLPGGYCVLPVDHHVHNMAGPVEEAMV